MKENKRKITFHEFNEHCITKFIIYSHIRTVESKHGLKEKPTTEIEKFLFTNLLHRFSLFLSATTKEDKIFTKYLLQKSLEIRIFIINIRYTSKLNRIRIYQK